MTKMNRKGARQIVFVCVALSPQNELVVKTIAAPTPHEASALFTERYFIPVKEVAGPFYKKRAQVIEATRTLKFSEQTKRGEYNGWIVDAMLLKEPENQAYLLFIKRLDNKKQPAPKCTVIVPISDLRFY